MSEKKEYQCEVDFMLDYWLELIIDPTIGGEGVIDYKHVCEVGVYEGCDEVSTYDDDEKETQDWLANEASLFDQANPFGAMGAHIDKNGYIHWAIMFKSFGTKVCGGPCDNTGGYVYHTMNILNEHATSTNTSPPITIEDLRNRLLKPCGYGDIIGVCEFKNCLGNYARWDDPDWSSVRKDQIDRCYRNVNKDFKKFMDRFDCGTSLQYCEESPTADPSNFDTFNYRTQREKDLSSLGYKKIYRTDSSPFGRQKAEVRKYSSKLRTK